MDTKTLFDESDDGPVLRVHVQPGAGKTEVTGVFGNALKMKVGAPPEGGRANEMVVALLADSLDVPRDSLEITAGERSRSKRVLVRGVDPEALSRSIDGLLSADRRGRGARKRP